MPGHGINLPKLVSRWQSHAYYLTILQRSYSTHNSQIVPNPVFFNKNPRTGEMQGFARKRIGWQFQHPRKDYYNKLMFEKTRENTVGRVEHWSGRTVVSASTAEWAIRKHLYRCLDVSAAENVGRVLAERCLQFGITHVFYDQDKTSTESESLQAFLRSMKDGHVCLEEPDEIIPEYEPGIDYDKPNRYAEKKEWQDDIQVS